MDDLGAPSTICEMCETQEIRYVHYMEHPQYAETLGVGCVCAGNMESDYERAERREQALHNVAARRRRWLQRTWRTSANGNDYINTDGYNIVVYPFAGGWSFRIVERATDRKWRSRRVYRSEDRAKLGAFDTMMSLSSRD